MKNLYIALSFGLLSNSFFAQNKNTKVADKHGPPFLDWILPTFKFLNIPTSQLLRGGYYMQPFQVKPQAGAYGEAKMELPGRILPLLALLPITGE